MVMPKQSEMEIPLLEVIVSLGGKARPKEIYPLMADKFPQLTQDDLNMTIASGGNKWTNRIQWVRQHLIDKGELISPERVSGQLPIRKAACTRASPCIRNSCGF